MISGTRVVWKKESASFQSSTDVGRHRVAFVAGDGRVAGRRNVATADVVRVECSSVSAEFELTEWGGERIFIGGGVVTFVAGAESGRTSWQVALTRWCVSRRLKHRPHFWHLARVAGMTEDGVIRLVDSLGAKQRAFLYTDRLLGENPCFSR